jgi:UDP-GlcNAc:undecaprenyl-phosphate GlcNAc-1-phosphate transferase
MIVGLLAFVVGLVASLALTVPVRAFALRVGMVDRPGARKVHLQPIPLLGGLAIYSSVLLAMIVFSGPAITEILGILAGATLVVLVGTLDDRGVLHHQIKLFVAMPTAALILLASGIHAQVFSVYFHNRAATLADAALTVFWVTGVTASFSILDYMDGMCAGVAAVASFFFAVLALLSGQVLVSTLAAAVMGAAVGFLRWNFNPAKIFMGDGGAMFLGFLMAALTLKLRITGASHGASWLAPVLILGAALFDTLLVSISRSRRGLLPFTTPGKDHTGHRLVNLGMPTRIAVLTMYAVGCAFGIMAVTVSRMSSAMSFAMGCIVGLIALGGVALLERAPYERQQPKSKQAPEPTSVTFDV